MKTCPECGATIKLFSADMHTQCVCGFTAYNVTMSCVSWCKYARECVGGDAYEKLIGR